MSKRSFTQILAFIGGLLIFIDGILSLLGHFEIFIPGFRGWPITFLAFGWVNAVILIVIGVLIFFSVNIIQGFKIPYSGFWLIILGIAALIFSSYYFGASLVIIAAILWFLGAK